MATKFQVWVDNPTDANTLSSTDLANDPQKGTGFVSGTAASSSRVNTMLRQNSLVVAALMDSIAPTSDADLRSTTNVVKALFDAYFGSFFIAAVYNQSTNAIDFTLKSGTKASTSLANLLKQTMDKAKADKNGNDIATTYATKTELTQAIANAVTNVLNTAT